MKLFIAAIFISLSLWGASYTDTMQRTVDIKEANKIVCIGPGALRLITYLGLQNRLVGIEKTELDFDLKAPYRASLDKESVSKLPLIGQGGPNTMPNLESLISLKPDIIFSSFISAEQIDSITQKTKIPVVALSYGATYGGKEQKLEALKNSLKLIGEITGTQKRANELVEFMSTQEDELKKLKIESKKLYVAGIGYKGAQGITSTESDYPPFLLLGVKNSVMGEKSGHAFIQEESILASNPDIIFLDLFGQKIINEEIQNKSEFYKSLDAFKNKKIFWLYPYNFYNTNIENIYLNSWIIASHLGVSVDVESKKREIYEQFLGKEALQKLSDLKLPEF